MTTYNTISAATSAATPAAKPVDTSAAASLGKDDFLKLLVAQLQNQDAMNPVDNSQYMGQLAQFSTLEQISNVGAELGRLRASSQVDQAVSMIGKTVGYVTPDGTAVSGVVASVSIQDGEIFLKVGEAEISPTDVTTITASTTP